MTKEKEVTFTDTDNSTKAIQIGDPFLRDGRLWITIKIGKEVVGSFKMEREDVSTLMDFLHQWLSL